MFKIIAMFGLKNNKMAMSKFSRWKHDIQKQKKTYRRNDYTEEKKNNFTVHF